MSQVPHSHLVIQERIFFLLDTEHMDLVPCFDWVDSSASSLFQKMPMMILWAPTDRYDIQYIYIA